MSKKYEKLKTLLKELFQLDQPDLDFGLYRIMHAKSAEVSQFLDQDLLPQVKEAFALYQTADKAEIKKELDKVVAGIEAAGMDPEQSPKVAELRARLASEAVDVGQLESEVYDHLFSFFRRYYSEGDFLSKRVYKPGVYAIPYEGEEVKLHWANADQYYIKTSEYLRDYAFRLRPDDEAKPMRVHFRLVDAAEGEHGNVKATAGKDRRFKLAEADALVIEDDELIVRFTYQPDPAKQKELNSAAEEALLATDDAALAEWIDALRARHRRADGTDSDHTRLRIHLDRYTARNTFDYFIHKNLGTFLRRELDFYVKNEVMHLDDIENESVPRVDQYLSKIKVIRKIAGKIIDFLAQLEDFQKKLWLKKKFVVGANYCITLDRISEEFYPEIAANDAQREEWVRLFGIDAIEGDLLSPTYSNPLTVEFLGGNKWLPVDTRWLDAHVKARLLGTIDDVGHSDGLLIRAENAQALRLLGVACGASVRFMYLDPPFNTGNDGFVYKDSYQHSSWSSMMYERLTLAHHLLADDGSIAISIDDRELAHLRLLLDRIFGKENLVSLITVQRASVSGHKTINQGVVVTSEFVLLYAKDKQTWTGNTVFAQRERDERYSKFVVDRDKSPDQWSFMSVADAFANRHGKSKQDLRKSLGNDYNHELDQFVYECAASIVRLAPVRPGAVGSDFREALAKSNSEKDRVLRFKRKGYDDAFLFNGEMLLFYSNKVAQIGDRVVTVEKASDIWTDVMPNDLHNEGGVSFRKGKKPETLIGRLVELGSDPGDLVVDFFAGSATTMAVAQKLGRRWVGVEIGDYFDEVTLARLKHVLKGEGRGISKAAAWKGGGCFSYAALESYEDALNNLEARRSEMQAQLLLSPDAQGSDGLKEQYVLRYMLDVETRGSQSLLNVDAFTDPTAYTLKVKRPGSDESREVNVDLLETFNWLIGLTVKHIAAPKTFGAAFERDSEGRLRLKGRLKQETDGTFWFRTVTGTTPDGRRTLVIWRKLTGNPEGDNLVLDEWFTKQGYSSKDSEFDLIYVNGGNNLENLKTSGDLWKVRLIEEDFHRLMFETEGA